MTVGQLRARTAQAKADRRLQILACAAAVCAASSYDELTVADVAGRAGIAKGTVFRYFPTKEDLGRALAEEHLARWADDLDRRLARLPGPPAPDVAARLLVESLAGRRDLLALAARGLAPAEALDDAPAAASLERALPYLGAGGGSPPHAHRAGLGRRPAGDSGRRLRPSRRAPPRPPGPPRGPPVGPGNALASSRQATGEDSRCSSEFKTFLLRGNIVDLAVAVVIGIAFGAVVAALVADIITPLIAAIFGSHDFSALTFTINNSTFLYGAFINAVISFVLIAAAVFFVVVKPMNAIERAAREGRGGPDDRPCPECLSEIPLEARRCAYCTAEVGAASG